MIQIGDGKCQGHVLDRNQAHYGIWLAMEAKRIVIH